MRGRPEEQTSMVMLMTLESRVSKDHPIRRVKKLADEALAELSSLFDEMYLAGGRAERRREAPSTARWGASRAGGTS